MLGVLRQFNKEKEVLECVRGWNKAGVGTRQGLE